MRLPGCVREALVLEKVTTPLWQYGTPYTGANNRLTLSNWYEPNPYMSTGVPECYTKGYMFEPSRGQTTLFHWYNKIAPTSVLESEELSRTGAILVQDMRTRSRSGLSGWPSVPEILLERCRTQTLTRGIIGSPLDIPSYPWYRHQCGCREDREVSAVTGTMTYFCPILTSAHEMVCGHRLLSVTI